MGFKIVIKILTYLKQLLMKIFAEMLDLSLDK